MTYFSTIEFHEHVAEAAERIRPLPASVTKLASLAADPDATVNDITAVLMDDMGLTTSLLREANSAASAAFEPIETVQAAVVRLGTARVVAVAVAATLAEDDQMSVEGYGMEQAQFWLHARAASIVAESVAALSSEAFSGGLVTAALLQNVGSIVLSAFITPELYKGGLASSSDQAMAEREMIDVDHAEVGAALCRHWRLPDEICEAIEHHHLLEPGASPAAHALYLTDQVTLELASGVPGRDHLLHTPRYDMALGALGLEGAALLEHAEGRLVLRGFDVVPQNILPR